MVFPLGGGGKAEARGGGGGLVADVGVGGDEFEEIEGDVFRAAGGEERGAGFHRYLSMRGVMSMVAGEAGNRE